MFISCLGEFSMIPQAAVACLHLLDFRPVDTAGTHRGVCVSDGSIALVRREQVRA